MNMELLAQRLPPQSLEAEVSVLGGILLDNEALSRVLEFIDETPKNFFCHPSSL